MPWDPLEQRFQDIDLRLMAVELGPYACPHCGKTYNSVLAAEACCDDTEEPA